MTDDPKHPPIATDAEDDGGAPEIHENGGDPLEDDPEEAPKPPPMRVPRAAVPPAPIRGR